QAPLMRALALLLLAACFDPNLGDEPFRCGPGSSCPPGYQCRGSDQVCAKPGAPDASPSCAPVGSAVCTGDTLDGWDGSGHIVHTTCAAGCNATATPNACYILAPQNLLNSACDATASDTVMYSGTLDTTDCAAAGGRASPQSGTAPELCVFKAATIVFPVGTKLRITGTRPAVFVATNTLELDGQIDVAGHRGVGGAGALAARPLGGNGANGGDNQIFGGGGAGHAPPGGAGGASPTLHSAGMAYGPSDNQSPLLPGSFGGAGGMPCATPGCSAGANGGGGGGALQLVGCQKLVVGAGAVVNAGGGGGDGGVATNAGVAAGGGDGGGSGGTILIEAPVISIPGQAVLAANGGAGGGGPLATGARGPRQGGPASRRSPQRR